MTLQVTIGHNTLGETGFIERPQFSGIEPRIFRIVNGDCLEWMARDEWHALGWARGRAYGHAAKANALQIG